MDELRFVRRDDLALIVANEAGEEFRFVVDDAALSELRHLSKRDRDTSKIRPREIQALVRAGKTRAQIAEATGLDDIDIERYEEPVLAERRYILELAHAVAVRTDANEDEDQRFGTVISERLIAIGADTFDWASWRDEEAGWMISLDFISHDVTHKAIWGFEHRKGALSPINSDAVSLSKQGDVGDRLIPKLRVVDSSEQSGRFDSDAFDSTELPLELDTDGSDDDPDTHNRAELSTEPSSRKSLPEGDADAATTDVNAEYERRREIDQRAIKSNENAEPDLSQTADLLDALRKRRGEREQLAQSEADASDGASIEQPSAPDPKADAGSPRPMGRETPVLHPAADRQATDSSSDEQPAARSIWSASGVSGKQKPATQSESDALQSPASLPDSSSEHSSASRDSSTDRQDQADAERGARKKRTSIPSWDDILFGTRSDEDPA